MLLLHLKKWRKRLNWFCVKLATLSFVDSLFIYDEGFLNKSIYAECFRAKTKYLRLRMEHVYRH